MMPHSLGLHPMGLTHVAIPARAPVIGEEAFAGCVELTEATLLGSVTSIGDGAFSSCRNLHEHNGQYRRKNQRGFH